MQPKQGNGATKMREIGSSFHYLNRGTWATHVQLASLDSRLETSHLHWAKPPKSPPSWPSSGLWNPNNLRPLHVDDCCGDSRSYRAKTMKENKSSRTKTKTQDKGQPKALFSTVDFSKAVPFYKCRSSPFIGRRTDFLHSENTLVRNGSKTEYARLYLGNLQLGLHVIGAS
jgi:hypothetical protein